MAELLSIPASVVGLLQALELVRNSLSIIRNLKNAPTEARRIESDLQKAQTIVADIEKLVKQRSSPTSSNDPSQAILHSQILGLKADIDILRKLIGPHLFQDTGWARFKIRIKWATGLETRLIQVCDRLAGSLQFALSLYTMYSSDECRIVSLQVQNHLGALIQPQSAQEGAGVTGVTRTSDSRVQNRVLAETYETALQLPQIPMSNRRLGIPSVTTFVYGSTMMCAGLLTEICPILYNLSTNKAGDIVRPLSRTDWIQARIHGLLHDIFSKQVGECDSSTPFLAPDQYSAARDANVVDPHIPTPPKPHDITPRSTQADTLARSTLLFFLKSICLIETTSVELLGRQSLDEKNHDISLTLQHYQPPASTSTLESDMESFTRCRIYVAVATPTPTTSGPAQQPTGVIVQFSEIYGPSGQGQLWRTLRTFGVHPRTSRVFEHIRTGDVASVQRMLSLRLIAPNDRDEEGNSLLWYCLEQDTNYDMCELLLREGADPSDCNRRGDHALAILVIQLSLRGEAISPASLHLIDLLLKYCHTYTTSSATEPTATLHYKCRSGEDLAPAGLLHCATPRRHHSPVFTMQLPTLFGKFVQFNSCGHISQPLPSPSQLPPPTPEIIDLELADKNGNTALLYSLFYHPVLALVQTATYLLNAGADTTARNKYGEGPLHLLCRRLSACSITNLSDDVRDGVVRLIARLVVGTENGGKGKGTGTGRDPVEGNQFGYTAIDAAMTPVAWPLFCEGLRVAGRDVKGELGLLDFAAGVVWGVGELEGVVEVGVCDFVERRAGDRDGDRAGRSLGITVEGCVCGLEECESGRETLCCVQVGTVETVEYGDGGEEHSDRRTCYLCGGGVNKRARPPPFDEFLSDIVVELGQGVHMVKYNHEDRGECLKVHEEDSCYPLDYHPAPASGMMTVEKLKGRSWRRHVAAALWERGLLG